jgi:ribosomal protein S18 acetylase RimI-like enzyme
LRIPHLGFVDRDARTLGREITIRPAGPSDEQVLGRLGGALMRQHHAFDARRFIQVDEPEDGYGRFLVGQLRDDDCVVLVAEQKGAVIGYVYAGLEPMSWKELRAACGFVHDVCVDEGARRSGAGEKLVREAIRWLEAKGSPRVMLWSAAQNEGAQRLFEKLGFRRTMVEMTRERT